MTSTTIVVSGVEVWRYFQDNGYVAINFTADDQLPVIEQWERFHKLPMAEEPALLAIGQGLAQAGMSKFHCHLALSDKEILQILEKIPTTREETLERFANVRVNLATFLLFEKSGWTLTIMARQTEGDPQYQMRFATKVQSVLVDFEIAYYFPTSVEDLVAMFTHLIR